MSKVIIPFVILVAGACGGTGEAAEAREPAIVRRAAAQQQLPPVAQTPSQATVPGTPQTQEPAPYTAHPDQIQPGLALQRPFRTVTNPFAGDAARRKEGAQLFIAYNCMDCHGADGSGAMGPSLADNRWHFGGSAGEVFESIYEGRPDGMPSWGGRISDQQIWALVTYVQSLGAGRDVSSENFTGKTIEKMGH